MLVTYGFCLYMVWLAHAKDIQCLYLFFYFRDLTYHESIGIDDLWKEKDQLVIVRGVAGIGKSTMIKRYVLKWAKDEILASSTDNAKSIDFLFFFECRELNTTPNIGSPEEMLKTKYPDILKHINISDLQTIANRVMIVVDGLDELQGIYDEDNSKETFPTSVTIKNLIDTNSSFLKGHKTIACGRPKACGFIQRLMENQAMKSIEVCGFNQNKTIEYIERFFKNDLIRAEKIKEIVKRPIIRTLSTVPVFLWIICLLYCEDFEDEITSVTELYTYALFTFLKKHLRGCKTLEKQSLCKLIKTKEFGEIVFSLAKLSCKMYMEHKVIFTDDDIKDIKCSIPLEQTGFITKYSVGRFGQETYQFKHLAFQEYLCALYICIVKNISKYDKDRQLSSVITTILGLHCLAKEGKNQLFAAFYERLEMVYKNSRTWKERLLLKVARQNDSENFTSFINECVMDTQDRFLNNIRKKEGAERNELICQQHIIELTRKFREYGWLFEESCTEKMRQCDMVVWISRSQSPEILEFLRSLKITQIHRLTFIMDMKKHLMKDADCALISMLEKEKKKILSIRCACTVSFCNQPNKSSYEAHGVEINISIRSECKLPTGMKEIFDTIIVRRVNSIIKADGEKDFYIFIADLIEHVLENQGKKKLVIEPIGNSKTWKIFKDQFYSEFGQKKHFDKIVFKDN